MTPSHVACILDGNGRWAQARGMVRFAGHSHGADAARRTVEAADDMGLEWLSMYVFSTENWGGWHRDRRDHAGDRGSSTSTSSGTAVFLPDLWPDMTPEKFQDAIEVYRHRSRRFGKVAMR